MGRRVGINGNTVKIEPCLLKRMSSSLRNQRITLFIRGGCQRRRPGVNPNTNCMLDLVGEQTIAEAVYDFYECVLADPEQKQYFSNTALD